ncbi:MAG: Fpg/Nei family DNA glycosylase [Thermoanaerobaculia bacterium]|nr:Fpg/Nei family DNA glycosylase [Thermoanaerobaculia bacterium]
MPEGDTIFRAARTLHQALAGRVVTRFETALAPLAAVDVSTPIAGRRVERVLSAGKHLIIDFSDGLHLRTHMRMNGSWHIYRLDERWRRPRRDMRIVITTDAFVAVGFNIPVAEFLDVRGLERQEDLRRIGPDLLGHFDPDEAFRRIRARGDAEIANVLLNQRVIAGIGNVFKSEILFVCNVNPFDRVETLPDATLREIIRVSEKLLRVNVREGEPAQRRTTGSLDRSRPLWVYQRHGDTCRRCRTPIEYGKQGSDARGTYWCPRCQKPAPS